MDKYLDTFRPTLEQIQLWAFDTEMYFVEQDEDLALHQNEYIPKLLELASDINCPKAEYCLSILTNYSRLILANRQVEDVLVTLDHLKKVQFELSYQVRNWKNTFLFLADILLTPRPISPEEADKIGWRLTVGEFCSREFKKSRMFNSGVVEYRASTSSYIEYLYINLQTSYWCRSRHFRLDDSCVL